MKKGLELFLGISVLMLLIVGCNNKGVVAKVGKSTITDKEFTDMLNEASYYYGKDFVKTEQGKNQVLDGAVKELVLVEAAKKKGLHNTKEYKDELKQFEHRSLVNKMIQSLREKELVVTDKEVQDVYNEDLAYYQNPIQVKVSHILVADEATINDVVKKLNAGEKFSDLAAQYSLDTTSGRKGGELDWFGKGDMVAEFENAAFALSKGQISEIVKTQFGYHVIMKIDERKIDPIKLEDVSDKLKKIIERKKFDDWMTKQEKSLGSKINDKAVAKIDVEEKA